MVKPLLASKHEIVGILESMPRDFTGRLDESFLKKCLKKLYEIIKREDLFLENFCRKNKTPYSYIWRENAQQVAAWVEGLRPDLIVIYSMSQLLGNDILKIPHFGVINLHPSYLPDYRGANPDFWQYYDMEINPGVTVHYVNSGEDTGDIIYQERIYVPLGTKSPARLDKLIGELGVSLTLKAINAISRGDAPRINQPTNSGTIRARNIKPEEHGGVVDWETWPVERVWNILCGTELWLNAIAPPAGVLAGQRWVIKGYEKVDATLGVPGQVGVYKNRKCVFAKGGVIYIGVTFDIKKTILKILKR